MPNKCFVFRRFSDHANTLSVSIPEEAPLNVLLGHSVTIPCYFINAVEHLTVAPSTAPLTPRIKWSRHNKGHETVLLVATDGQIRVNEAYKGRISLPNYPLIPTDVSLEIVNLLSSDSGVYRCEIMHGIEDSQDTVTLNVKGKVNSPMINPFFIIIKYSLFKIIFIEKWWCLLLQECQNYKVKFY